MIEELRQKLTGRVCLVGIGNTDLGDDGLGVKLAEAVRTAGHADVVIAETTPESWIRTASFGFDNVLLLDAVQLGAEPGGAVLLDASQIESRFPQVSTHKLSLGLLAKLLQSYGPRVWLLGVQPETLKQGAGLSAPVAKTVEALQKLLVEVLKKQ
jgi:hydrogenase maturation protease